MGFGGTAIVQRWLAIALIGLLALVWAGSSAIACSQVTRHDCCSGGERMPCGEQGSGKVPGVASMVCCAKAPAPSAVMAVEVNRSAQIQPADPQSPDLSVLAVGIDFLTPVDGIALRIVASCEAPGCADSSLTYLRTLRLRL